MTDAEKAKRDALAKYHTQLDALVDEAILDKDGVSLFALMDACVDRMAWFAASLDSHRGEDRKTLDIIIRDLTRVYQQVIDRRRTKSPSPRRSPPCSQKLPRASSRKPP
jgi:hypothetical protein